MMKKWLISGLCMAFLMMSTYAFAESVYVTQRGKKYHKADCRLIKNRDTKELDQKEAIEQGYKPCQVCFKDKVLKEKTTKESEASKKVKLSKKKSSEKKK